MNIINKIKCLYSVRNELLLCLKNFVVLTAFQKQWRVHNPKNGTTARTIFPMEKVEVGEGTYGDLWILAYDNEKEKLKIGNYCSIAGNVTFLLGGEHDYKCLSTYPFWTHIFKRKPFKATDTKGEIVVEDDVWIGYGTIILSGVKIGRGSVIGAGSVVSKNIPPYSVYVNNRVIKYRFDEKLRERLMMIPMKNVLKLSEEEQYYFCAHHIKLQDLDRLLALGECGESKAIL